MKQVTIITAKHSLNGMLYAWRIGKQQLVELVMALTNHRQFILAVETKYGSKLVEYVGTRLEDSKVAKNHKKVQAVLVGYNHYTIENFYKEDNDFIEDYEEKETTSEDSINEFLEEDFE